MLTEKEIKLCQDGFFHCVDSGYLKFQTPADVVKYLEVRIEYARREIRIGKMWNLHEEGGHAEKLIEILEPMVKVMEGRV